MRRTLTVLVTTAAFVLPAAAASASVPEGSVLVPSSTNASCNNAKGGNYGWTGMTDNDKGNSARAVDCSARESTSVPTLPGGAVTPSPSKPSKGMEDLPPENDNPGAL